MTHGPVRSPPQWAAAWADEAVWADAARRADSCDSSPSPRQFTLAAHPLATSGAVGRAHAAFGGTWAAAWHAAVRWSCSNTHPVPGLSSLLSQVTPNSYAFLNYPYLIENEDS